MASKALRTTQKKRAAGLSRSMSEAAFDNGYWYAAELRTFAEEVGVPAAGKLRKDELEKAIRHFVRTKEIKTFTERETSKSGPRDIDEGLRLDLLVVNYTSNRETKDFIEREAAKIEPDFERRSGTRYLLNRWREEQLSKGRRITYGDLVRQAIELNRTKQGPLRVEHGRYINFISDFMAANKGASQREAVSAWEALKEMDAPKTYDAWAKAKQAGRRTRRSG